MVLLFSVVFEYLLESLMLNCVPIFLWVIRHLIARACRESRFFRESTAIPFYCITSPPVPSFLSGSSLSHASFASYPPYLLILYSLFLPVTICIHHRSVGVSWTCCVSTISFSTSVIGHGDKLLKLFSHVYLESVDKDRLVRSGRSAIYCTPRPAAIMRSCTQLVRCLHCTAIIKRSLVYDGRSRFMLILRV
jgi:hypothetical protein